MAVDTLGAHKAPRMAEAIESRRGRGVPLLPYSPDLNSIERVWAKVKAWLGRIAVRGFDALGVAIADRLRAVSVAECAAYLRCCGDRE